MKADSRHAPGRLVARAALNAALATTLEVAVRASWPVPFGVRAGTLAMDAVFYAVAALPAVVVGFLPGGGARRAATILMGAPLALAVTGLAFTLTFTTLHHVALVGAAALMWSAVVNRLVTVRGLVVATAVALVTAGGGLLSGRVPAAPAVEPSVLLIVLDTTAVGHLSAFGYVRPTSPNLAALAARSLVYRRAVSTAPWTIPSHGAIFTGRYPSQLGFDGAGFAPAAAPGTIAGDLAGTGREGYAICANPLLLTADLLREGFRAVWSARRLTQPFPLRLRDAWAGDKGFQSHGAVVTALALDWLDRIAPRGRPWLLFLNYLDPHAPYRPPAREQARFAPGVDPDALARRTEPYNAGRRPLTPETVTAMRALYDGEIAAMDRAVGTLLAGLAARGYDDRHLLVVVTADHGENLAESGGVVGHMLGMYDRVLHVPLTIAGPGVQPGEVSVPVQTVQLRATLRQLLALPPLSDIAAALPPWGRAPDLLISEHPEPRWYFDDLAAYDPISDLEAWRGNWVAVEHDGTKLVFNDAGQGATYDLRADPDESHPGPLADGSALMEAYAAWRGTRRTAGPLVLPDTTRRALRGLGYLR